jgi:16S rRNA (guanine527-N7)-methyltransferase
MEIETMLVDFLGRCGLAAPVLPDLHPLGRLYEDLLEVNQETNLTRITSAEDFWIRHVADSLALAISAPEVLRDPLKVADVGCGGGFPLLVLAWANPLLQITGIEARQKKAEFVAREIERLGLEQCQAVARQAREAARLPEHAGQYDLVLLRAVGTAGDFLKECRGLLKPQQGARVIFYKTPQAIEKERKIALREARKYGFVLKYSEVVELPQESGPRQFLICERQ